MLTGVPQYAIYLLHRFYNRRMKVENLCALAAYLITETSTQDPKVGGRVFISKITPAGYSELTEAEVEGLNQSNEEQNQKLRRFFYEEEAAHV